MKKRTNFNEVNRGMRIHHKVNTKILTFTDVDIEKQVTKSLEQMIKNKIKARFEETPFHGGGTAEDVVGEVMEETGFKKPEEIKDK